MKASRVGERLQLPDVAATEFQNIVESVANGQHIPDIEPVSVSPPKKQAAELMIANMKLTYATYRGYVQGAEVVPHGGLELAVYDHDVRHVVSLTKLLLCPDYWFTRVRYDQDNRAIPNVSQLDASEVNNLLLLANDPQHNVELLPSLITTDHS